MRYVAWKAMRACKGRTGSSPVASANAATRALPGAEPPFRGGAAPFHCGRDGLCTGLKTRRSQFESGWWNQRGYAATMGERGPL